MPKPCGHEGYVHKCRACHLWATSPEARAKWGYTPSPTKKAKTRPVSSPRGKYPEVKCAKLGDPTGAKVPCESCAGKVEVKLFRCQQFGECTTNRQAKGVQCCEGCNAFESRKPGGGRGVMVESDPTRRLRWSYGVTTVPLRRGNLLPRTLESLKAGGFDNPRLFVDGDRDSTSWEKEHGLRVTCRFPALRTFGNWVTALWELYIREPMADRFAIFQDDLVCGRNLRGYLESCPFPARGYQNLLTWNSNDEIAPAGGGWYEARTTNPGQTTQTGRGAVALVFNLDGVMALLGAQGVLERPRDAAFPHSKIDGMIVTCLNKLGFREWVHSPSLVQHTGEVSSMGNNRHPAARSFMGGEFDLMGLLK